MAAMAALGPGLEPLLSEFRRVSGHVRVLLIVSPT